MILCLGPAQEPVCRHMVDALRAAGAGVLMVADEDWEGPVRMQADRLSTREGALELAGIRAVFSRLGVGDVPLPRGSAALLSWLNRVEGIRVVNRPWTQVANSLKPFQYGAILRAGLAVPPTCILQQVALPGPGRDCRLVAKSLGGAQRPAESDPCDGEGDCQIQQRIEGDNVRVHVIGDAVFALRVRSAALDYRFAGLSGVPPQLIPFELDARLARVCVELTRGMGLETAGIDLIMPPQGPVYCLEVNPNPGFTWFEQMSGQPITQALIGWLTLNSGGF